jgi:hypothetical protein
VVVALLLTLRLHRRSSGAYAGAAVAEPQPMPG